MRDGPPFLYFDNPYFRRDDKSMRFRLIKSATHLTHLLPEQKGRVIDVPELQPWKPEGRRQHILVIPPSPTQLAVFGCNLWLNGVQKRLKDATSRPVVVKHQKYDPLAPELERAFAVVTWASVAGVEAAVAGVPVFSTERCPSWPINAGALEDIERPRRVDRREWLRSLGYACWHMDELETLDLETYDYARSDNCS